jgi:hypothetical protein
VEELQRLYNLPVLLALSFALQEVQIWSGSSLKRKGERTNCSFYSTNHANPTAPAHYLPPPSYSKSLGTLKFMCQFRMSFKKTLTLKAKHKTKGLGIVTLILLRQQLLLI